ncbi:NnrU family protein [Aliiroseovarius subalbicans]|uniref:NnrU family protein n=1 Tax=Aliiroseovarius subalbicans TaxID=2925840 RepID=UPI001F588DA4|nr:NnrU family protein [Aliiroseovarius subalbicans]MCI2398510.1 NnrU family protein [Aliiroseovarius subalbicans]
MGWIELIAAFAAFFLSHSVPVRPAVKRRLVAQIGARGFTLAYSALSLAVLSWLIVAASRAPFVALWDWAPWHNHVLLGAMALAVWIAAMAVGRPNSLSFGGAQNARFDPLQPGIIGWMRHPLLAALFLWAAAHMLPNGNLAHVILFGTFAGFSLLGMRIIDRRQRRVLGAERWQQLSATHRSFSITQGGMIRSLVAVTLYLLLLWLHGPVIGVSPLV